MSSGLQRRRVAGGSVTPTTSEFNDSPDSTNITRAGFNEDGKRIAYDPEDINNTKSDQKQPKLTLMEEILLLGIKDKQGYLSFWNDNISYALRGAILMELAFRGKIAMVNDINRRRFPLSERYVEVIDDKITGEALLDETIKIMKMSEPLSVATWIDYLSGETWNLTKISYQLKQVRERLAKGLVDKGILRTEKRNFFLFDMATHPVADTATKDEIKRRVITFLTARTIVLPNTPLFPDNVPLRFLRSVAVVAGAYAANVLENVLTNLSYDARDQAFGRADELINDYSEWPFIARAGGGLGGAGANLTTEISEELTKNGDKELQLEIIPAV
ncbi:hypothetical protein D0Z03_001585 [Geotrichum reessii]|nr:hypothetical protein D0Z03_001585 [Galactomyces reessii]